MILERGAQQKAPPEGRQILLEDGIHQNDDLGRKTCGLRSEK